MKINDLSNLSPINNSNKSIPQKAEKKGEKTDSINISSEAREIHKNEQEEKLREIKNKISEGYYDRKEVIQKTAMAILKELDSK